MSFTLRSLQRAQLLHERTYQALRSAILAGELSTGARLIETHLAEQLQVSRTPIREALRLLERDHLVESDSDGALRVAVLSIDDAIQLYDCRMALEQLSIVTACETITQAQLDQLEFMLHQAERSVIQAPNSLTKYQLLHLDYQFHRLFATSSGNGWLVQILDQVFDKMALLRLRTIEHNPHVLEICDEHRQIFEAVRDRDAATAAQAIGLHLAASKDRVVQEIKQLEQKSGFEMHEP